MVRILMITAVATIFLVGCSEQEIEAPLKENVTSPWLPDAGLGAWAPKDDASRYIGDELFAYINGGADICHEYGFKSVVVQEYENSAKNLLRLEIFEMSDSLGAFGLYSYKKGSDGKPVIHGDGGFLEEYYLNFRKGPMVVTITSLDESEKTLEGLEKIAQAVDLKLKGKGELPKIISFLPKKDRIFESIKYFRGYLGLFNSYAFFLKDCFLFHEAAVCEYVDKSTVYVFRYETKDQCSESLKAVRDAFSNSKRYKDYSESEPGFSIRDMKGNKLSLKHNDKVTFLITLKKE